MPILKLSGHLDAVEVVIHNLPILLTELTLAREEAEQIAGFATLVKPEIGVLLARRVTTT